MSREEAMETSALAPLRHENGRPIVPAGVIRRARAVAQAIFLSADGPPPDERLDWLARELEDFLARAGSQTRMVFRLALFVVGFLAPLSIGRFRSLSSLDPSERARALSRLEDSSFGPPVLAVKALLCVLYYEHPDAASEVGFDGSCLIGR